MQEVKSANSADILPTDIVFECPSCGKSLAIDQRGAGYLVTCPDCKTEIEVPGGPEGEELADAETGGDEDIIDIAARCRALEIKQEHDKKRMKLINDELALIQAALDRISALIEDSQVEG